MNTSNCGYMNRYKLKFINLKKISVLTSSENSDYTFIINEKI